MSIQASDIGLVTIVDVQAAVLRRFLECRNSPRGEPHGLVLGLKSEKMDARVSDTAQQEGPCFEFPLASWR